MDNRCEILTKKTGNSHFYGQSLWNFDQKNR
jgi:hypothetical protein